MVYMLSWVPKPACFGHVLAQPETFDLGATVRLGGPLAISSRTGKNSRGRPPRNLMRAGTPAIVVLWATSVITKLLGMITTLFPIVTSLTNFAPAPICTLSPMLRTPQVTNTPVPTVQCFPILVIPMKTPYHVWTSRPGPISAPKRRRPIPAPEQSSQPSEEQRPAALHPNIIVVDALQVATHAG